MEKTAAQGIPPWRRGDRLVLDHGRREVVVEDVVAGQVCCRWIDSGIARTSWIPLERLLRVRQQPDRGIVIP